MTAFVLPVHPATGMQAIGVLRGRPVWPVLGASDDDVEISDVDPADTGEGEEGDDAHADSAVDDVDGQNDKPVDDQPLGPAGEKALAAEKEKRRLANSQARTLRRELAEARAQIATYESSQGGSEEGEEVDVDAIREQAKAEAKAEAKEEAAAEAAVERVTAKIEALAARRFKDPEDALTHLMRTHDYQDFLGDGNKIDVEAITDALDELLSKKSYLGVEAQGPAKRFQGSGDGGARKGPKGPSQLTETDLKRMSPEEIVAAHDQGRFADLL